MKLSDNKFKVLEQLSWKRKEHFDFYKQFEQPYFNICCDLNAQALFEFCKKNKMSFYNAYMFLLMKAVNSIEIFRHRFVDEQIRVYEQISIGSTQMADDETFRFTIVPFEEKFKVFNTNSTKIKEEAINANFMSDLAIKKQEIINTIYVTVIPWISFTSFNHALHSCDDRGIPRFVFGKMRSDSSMPFSVSVHHALVDGLHVGLLVEKLQNYFNEPHVHLA